MIALKIPPLLSEDWKLGRVGGNVQGMSWKSPSEAFSYLRCCLCLRYRSRVSNISLPVFTQPMSWAQFTGMEESKEEFWITCNSCTCCIYEVLLKHRAHIHHTSAIAPWHAVTAELLQQRLDFVATKAQTMSFPTCYRKTVESWDSLPV